MCHEVIVLLCTIALLFSFWCAEQAFEQYAPGVIEAVSGYSGPSGIGNPTYRNHPGHYEVILIEYDPLKTTYKLLVEYAWRNIDPFNGAGQFCDYGPSYYPAIFYDTNEETAMFIVPLIPTLGIFIFIIKVLMVAATRGRE